MMKGHFKLIILSAILLAGVFGDLILVNFLAKAEGIASPCTAIIVNTLEDDNPSVQNGNCSLREAVSAANTNTPIDTCPAGTTETDTINFSVSGMILLDLQLDIQAAGGPLVIESEGAITLSGGDSVRIFYVNSGANLVLESMEITSGSHDEGGGIYNSGDLVVRNSILSDNIAWSYTKGGGGIYNIGTLSVISSTLVGNYTFYHLGGGIYNLGQLTLRKSILDSNGAYHNGGGIYNGGVMTITNSTLTDNSANYYGGGIENYGTVNLMTSTLAGNHALYGGGVSNGSVMTITNSTLSGNSAGYDGGAIYVGGGSTLTIDSSTLSENSAEFGGGIDINGMGVTLQNTILANNTATIEGPDCYAMTLTSEGYNLIGDKSGCMFTPTTGDLTGIDAKLAPLQDNGGPASTHALSSGSLAIDAGNPKGCTDDMGNPSTSDQRGFPRIGRCDIGAYEWQPIPFAPKTTFLPTALRSCSPPLYFDDFSDHNSGWPDGESSNVLIGYLNNEYRILVKNPRVTVGIALGFEIDNYSAVLDVRNETGIDGAYGLIFDSSGDESQGYVFVVGPSNRYAIWRTTGNPSTLLLSGSSDSIHPGTASNQLKIERKGSQIWAYANEELLNIITDATFTGLRYIGLVVQSNNTDPNVDIRFDNFTVNSPSCTSSSALLSQEVGLPVMKVMDMGLPKSWQVQNERHK